MKGSLLILWIAVSLVSYACQKRANRIDETPVRAASGPANMNSLVGDTVTSKPWGTLIRTYDNASHRAVFVLNGDTIRLRQDTVASGLKYSNAEYDYTEHQGTTMLRKGDKIVFSTP